jgi:radical SAM superfamily enzyme YgiQ (UPF0313 family)
METIEANFLIGSHPDETLQDIGKTRDMIRELRPQRLLVSIVTPFPGTRVREQMLERDLIQSNDWRRYMLLNDMPPPWRTTNFTGEQLMEIQNSILTEFYFSLRNIVTSIKYIRSLSLLKVYFFAGLGIAKGFIVSRARSFRPAAPEAR